MTPEHARVVTELLTESINRGKSPIKSDSYNIAAKQELQLNQKKTEADIQISFIHLL